MEDLSYIQDSLRNFAIPLSSVKTRDVLVKTHSRKNLMFVTDSIKKFGQIKPVVLDAEGYCVAGNAIVYAMRSLGYKYIAAISTSLTGEKALEYEIVDNRSSQAEIGSEWDIENVNQLVASLGEGFDESMFDLSYMISSGKEKKQKTKESGIRCPKCGKRFEK